LTEHATADVGGARNPEDRLALAEPFVVGFLCTAWTAELIDLG
jgi:hypothetical protein